MSHRPTSLKLLGEPHGSLNYFGIRGYRAVVSSGTPLFRRRTTTPSLRSTGDVHARAVSDLGPRCIRVKVNTS